MSNIISVRGLKKSFHNTEVFADFSIDVEEGQITALFGPNGSGKSTLLNLLAGIVKRDGGDIQMPNLDRFRFSYIFQNYRDSLLPWRTNFENVALPLEIQGKTKQEITKAICELEELFGVKLDWDRYPYQLSGGQQQILAFVRALVTNPKILFVDEPFSALDYENNLRLRTYLQKYYLAFKPTIILITHNVEEAVYLASKIVVLSKRPTQVVQTIANKISYPRTVETMATEGFNRVKAEALQGFIGIARS
jgi:NitT/TauT family transport system ATP-binding protein